MTKLAEVVPNSSHTSGPVREWRCHDTVENHRKSGRVMCAIGSISPERNCETTMCRDECKVHKNNSSKVSAYKERERESHRTACLGVQRIRSGRRWLIFLSSSCCRDVAQCWVLQSSITCLAYCLSFFAHSWGFSKQQAMHCRFWVHFFEWPQFLFSQTYSSRLPVSLGWSSWFHLNSCRDDKSWVQLGSFSGPSFLVFCGDSQGLTPFQILLCLDPINGVACQHFLTNFFCASFVHSTQSSYSSSWLDAFLCHSRMEYCCLGHTHRLCCVLFSIQWWLHSFRPFECFFFFWFFFLNFSLSEWRDEAFVAVSYWSCFRVLLL